jgi:hypothetical protein
VYINWFRPARKACHSSTVVHGGSSSVPSTSALCTALSAAPNARPTAQRLRHFALQEQIEALLRNARIGSIDQHAQAQAPFRRCRKRLQIERIRAGMEAPGPFALPQHHLAAATRRV